MDNTKSKIEKENLDIEVKIGLEIHSYVLTNEKLFCDCKAIHGIKNAKPNFNICPICVGEPGIKPLLPNEKAVDKSIEIGLVLGCKINNKIPWQRKHYSWPDLPKGYQNTLSGPYAIPVGVNGKFEGIKITECHLEEDPAAWNPQTGEVDYNRSGVPLIEIVTEPDFSSSEEVSEWLKNLKNTLSYMGYIDVQSGIKADVNISLPQKKGERVEIKNVNSINNIVQAIEYEVSRQKQNQTIKIQETRRFDEKTGKTFLMRKKEKAADYRFISDPDLPVLRLDKKRIEKLKKNIPESPKDKIRKLIKQYKLDKDSAEILTKNFELVKIFEFSVNKVPPELVLRWIVVELLGVLNYNKKEISEVCIQKEHFSKLLEFIEKSKITEQKAREILRKFIPKSFDPEKEIKKYEKISDNSEIEEICEKVISQNKKAIEDYKSGEEKSFNFLIGQVMKISKARADVSIVRKILKEKLE